MDESGIEATQALDFVDDGDDTDEDIDLNTPVAYLNVGCQKGFPGKLFPIFEGDNVIGRHDGCQVAIPLKALSREHACIEVKTGSHFIYDKGSRNRTRRNTHFLAAAVRYELKDKDKLIFGDVECEYQLQAANNDDGSETESESMFQTAPDDEVPVDDVDKKPLDEEDYHSDASSDILEPTQPFTKNTQSMLGTKSHLGETTIAQNITVEDTPASNRSKKFTGNVIIPESGSDTDGEDELPKETSAETSRLMIAETQSYVCESDISTDDEDNVGHKSSLLVAPTQAFIQGDDDDDDVSTCSETSPKKKHLMMAATQAYVGDSDNSVSPRKKLMLEPTQAYNMDVGVEPTQAYDMEGEDDSETAETHTEDEEQKQSGILFEPTQANVSNDQGTEEGDGNVSESSEELAETVDIDVATQAVENVSSDDKESKSAAVTEVCDTQVFEEQSADVGTKSSVPINDINSVETQVFEEVTDVTEKNNKVAEMKNEEKITQGFDKHTDPTQTFSEEEGNTFDFLGTSTLAVDNFDSEESCESTDKHSSADADNNQATQVFDNTDETCIVTDDLSETDGGKHKQKECPSKKGADLEAATQVFSDTVAVQEDATVAVEDTDVRSCSKDLNRGRKSKANNMSKKQSIAETVPIVHGEEQTQVFDETVAVEEIPEVMEPTEADKKLSKKIFDNSVKQSTYEEPTQVFDETVPVNEMTEVTKPSVKVNAKTHTTEESTQVFDETVAIEEIPEVSYTVKGSNEKQSNSEEPTQVFDETSAVEEIPEVRKPTTKYKDEIHITEEPTQVFDETIEVEEITEVIKPTTKHKNEIHTTEKSTEGPTQVSDATVAVEEIPEAIKPKKGGKKGQKKTSKQNTCIEQLTGEEPTQVFDETMAVDSIEQTVEPKSKSNSIKNLNPQSKEFEETAAKNMTVNETGDKISTRKSGRRKQLSADNTDMSDNVETSNNARTGRSKTRRNRTTNNDNDDALKSEELKTTKTEAVKKNANMRKSGRNSTKVEANDSKEKQTDNVRKSARNRKNVGKNDEDNAQSNSVVKENRNEKKEESNQEIGDTEAATQKYADDDPADAAATQRYGDDDDEDLTPDIDTVLAEEANQINIPLVETVVPSKSPLKSSLASPKKERSPSPKKVQFVSQKSETESESSENTRRSKRSNKGKAKVNLDFEAEENKPVSRNKKQKEEKHVDAADAMPEVSEVKEDKGKSTRKGKRGVKSQEPAKENETVHGIVEKAPDSVPVTSRRKGKLINSNSDVKQENEGKIEETKVKSEIDNTSKGAKRGGRKSTNSNVEVKQETSRATRTSLPNVLEHKLVKGNPRASKQKMEMTNTSEENDDKQIVSDGVKKEPNGSRRSKRQNKDEDSESVKNCEETEKTESKNRENNDLRPSRRGSRHKELKVKESDSMVDISESTKSDTNKSGVKAVKNDLKSNKIQVDEKNSNENEIKKDVTVVNRKGKRISAVSNSKSESDSQAVEVQEKGSRNKRSSRRNAGDDGDSATDKTIDNSELKKKDEVVETKKSMGRLKRKESASSSNDSQEGELGETPAKRQRRGKAPVISTPVSSNKQKSVKQLEESISNSPTLRKTTIEGIKAKVMFTGVVDEQGQKIVKELGGELVNSVMDCTHLVTDQVRRTVKFLCCLARGIPIVVPQWLISSKASGFFVDSAPFLVTDEASERKFKFRLDQSIDKASKDRMFNGYTIHVTKSVKPEPAQMKEILKCAGAKYCDTLPASSASGQVVVVSCIDDKPLCTPAVKAGIPVMSAEFILTGILRQDVDLVSFKLDIDTQGNKRPLAESHTETSKKRKR